MGPLGGSAVRQGAASVRVRCRADGGPERGLADQRQRCIRRCIDRFAGGCADRHTCSTTRAQACGGLDTAEALPRRCVRWRSRGRRWSGPYGPLDRTTLPPQRRAGWSSDCDTARCPSETAWGRATAAGYHALPAARSVAKGRAAPGRCPGRPWRLRTCQHGRLRQRVVHTRWGKTCARAGERLWGSGLRQRACWGSRWRSRTEESYARPPRRGGRPRVWETRRASRPMLFLQR